MSKKPTYNELEKKIAELQDGESRFRAIFEHAPLGILHYDSHGVITTCNDLFVGIIGSSKEALIGLDMSKLPNKEVVNALGQALKGKMALFEGEYSSVTAIKKTFVRLIFNPLFSNKGTVKGGIGIIDDVSKQKQAEDALKASEEKFRTAFQYSPNSMTLTRMEDGVYIDVNDAFSRRMGYSPEEAIGKSSVELDVWYDTEDRKRLVSELKKYGLVENFEAKFKGKNGQIKTALMFARELTIENKKLLLSMTQDITEKKQAEKALKESEKKYRFIAENIADVIWTVDMDMNFTYISPSVFQLRGYTDEEVLDQSLDQVITPDSLKKVFNLYEKKIKQIESGNDEGWEPVLFDLQQYCKDGTKIWTSNNARFLKDPDQKVSGILGTSRDITELKKTHELIIQSEKMMSIGGLAAGMAHEINNPLAGMMQNSQVIHNRLTKELPANNEAAQESGISMTAINSFMEKRGILSQLESINHAGRRAAKIINNMLSFAQKGDSVKREHKLNELLDKTIELAQNDYDLKKKQDFKQIKIIREYSPNIPTVLCVGSKIQQVFFNLLKNASEAISEDGREKNIPKIIVRLKKLSNMVCIEIEDNGPGLNTEIRKRIFEPFFSTKAVDKGTGLGLSVSYFIVVDDHGGEMEVESTLGKGTKFIIKLPLSLH